MAKRWCVMLVLALAVVFTAARNEPSDKGLKDEKNFLTYGGVGAFSGIGNNGLPFAGIGSGMGGTGGLVPIGGVIGTGGGFPLGGFGGGGGGGGAGVGPGTGAAGTGTIPLP